MSGAARPGAHTGLLLRMLPALTTLQISSDMKKFKGNPPLDARSWKPEQKLLEQNIIIILFSGRPGRV